MVKIKRIKKIKVNSFTFDITWDRTHDGGSFDYRGRNINIGVRGGYEDSIFQVITHELMELCAIEVGVRYQRPDVSSDYLFAYDHRQHELIASMLSSLQSQFLM